MSTERNFFQAMEEFGFFSHIYERLPQEITAVFEIARVLEDETNQLTEQLERFLQLATIGGGSAVQDTEEFSREIPTGEEYEADLIRNHHDIARVFPWQYTLPDELFNRRLAERTLWMPIAKAPRILPVADPTNTFGFDSRKQKVYVLFDTSSSMALHHRIHLAKAILYTFLKRNKEEMGYICVRTFDDHVGEAHTAVDAASYDALMRYTLRLTHLGEGTVLQKALFQALEDIHESEHLSGAEILIITDGAVALDEIAIKNRLDENVRIHTLKIGHATIFPSDSFIDEQIKLNPNYSDKQYRELLRQEEELREAMKIPGRKEKHEHHQHTLSRLSAKRAELVEKFRSDYGRELERLSSLYINIDDFSETHLFRANEETINDLQAIATALEAEAEEFLTSDVTKKLAILHDHVAFLMKYETDPGLLAQLAEIDAQLRGLIGSALGNRPQTSQRGQASQGASVPISEEDLRDLGFLLEIGGDKASASLLILVRWLWHHTGRRVARRLKRTKIFFRNG